MLLTLGISKIQMLQNPMIFTGCMLNACGGNLDAKTYRKISLNVFKEKKQLWSREVSRENDISDTKMLA